MSKEVSTEKKPDLKELAKILSDAYYNILQYTSQPEQNIVNDLLQLSKYSNDLPLAWFTNQFLDALLVLKARYLTSEQYQGLGSIIVLFSSWLRRLSSMDDARLTSVMDTLLNTMLLNTIPISIQKDAWVGWVSLIGKEQDIKVLDGMTKVIDITTNDDMAEAIDAGVAHALAQTTTLNDFQVESCKILLGAHIQYCAKRGSLDGPRAIMIAMEHVVDVRSKEKPTSRAEADLSTLVNMAIHIVEGHTELIFVRLAVLAGVVRMLQFNQGKNTKKVLGLREQAEDKFIQQLDMSLETMNAGDYTMNQDMIAFFAGQCIIQIPSEIVLKMNHLSTLFKTLSTSLLTSPYTFNNGSILSRLCNTPIMTEEITQLIQQPLFKDIGRLSRAIAKIIPLLLENEKQSFIESTLDRLVGFSYNVFFDWDRYLIQHANMKMTSDQEMNYKQLENVLWTYFKSLTFAFTVILKSVAVDGTNGLVQVGHAAQDIISVYANLHFITQHLGQGAGRQAYQETLTNAVAYLLHEECQLNRLLSLAFKEYVPSHYTKDVTPTVELLSPVKQARLTFFTDLIEQVMSSIDDQVLEQDILPVIYPILKWKRIENKDLYESAHTAIISAFLAEKSISQELAGVYSNILIENFPEPMNLDQFRFGYNTLIQALCNMDDALAWFTVQQLIIKIESLTSEKDMVLRNEYITALIDLLKPLSLGPFFPAILDEIEKCIMKQETKEIQRATLKILFDTVSGSGISDMRRTEAVGWFLKLKRQLNM